MGVRRRRYDYTAVLLGFVEPNPPLPAPYSELGEMDGWRKGLGEEKEVKEKGVR